MKRILKRFLFPTIITVLVIAIFCFLNLNGGRYDDGLEYTTYQIMFGGNYGKGTFEFFQTNPLAVIVTILIIAGAVLAWFNFKYDKFVVLGIFVLAAILTMLLPCTVNLTEQAKHIINAIEINGDKKMTILAGPYVAASICLVIACFAFFKEKFNSLFKIAK